MTGSGDHPRLCVRCGQTIIWPRGHKEDGKPCKLEQYRNERIAENCTLEAIFRKQDYTPLGVLLRFTGMLTLLPKAYSNGWKEQLSYVWVPPWVRRSVTAINALALQCPPMDKEPLQYRGKRVLTRLAQDAPARARIVTLCAALDKSYESQEELRAALLELDTPHRTPCAGSR